MFRFSADGESVRGSVCSQFETSRCRTYRGGGLGPQVTSSLTCPPGWTGNLRVLGMFSSSLQGFMSVPEPLCPVLGVPVTTLTVNQGSGVGQSGSDDSVVSSQHRRLSRPESRWESHGLEGPLYPPWVELPPSAPPSPPTTSLGLVPPCPLSFLFIP